MTTTTDHNGEPEACPFPPDAPAADLTRHIKEVEQESDRERLLEANASALALAGLIGTVTIDRRSVWLPAVVLAILLRHAIQGRWPPVVAVPAAGCSNPPGNRREKYALLRGDFDLVMAGRGNAGAGRD